MADLQEIKDSIAEILGKADLNKITAKKVRQELEAKLKVDLSDRKKEIDKIVMDHLEKEDDSRKRKGRSDSDDDDISAKKGRKVGSDSDDDKNKKGAKRGGGGGGGGAAKPAAGGKKQGSGYTRTCKLSAELSKVMGEENMARHEVVKRMWKIIKEKNLYDPKNKQFAICNDELLPVFGVKRFRTFGMMKYLKTHFVD